MSRRIRVAYRRRIFADRRLRIDCRRALAEYRHRSSEYRRHRRSVFAGIFAGYAAYYLVRNNLALALPDVLAEYPQHSKAERT